MSASITWPSFLKRLRWIDGTPLAPKVEPYRRRLFEAFHEEREPDGRPRINLLLAGRAKKNSKTLDLMLSAIFCVITETLQPGYDSDAFVLANDLDQSRDDLGLAKKLVKANPVLEERLVVRRDVIERRDGRGRLEILPGGDAVGLHGKTFRFCGYDEIHGHKTWDLFEAMQPDPNRMDAQQWITSYASLYDKPGVPLHDMVAIGKAGSDSSMLFSWYAADFTTDSDFADKLPEERANPSMPSWGNPGYLAQQQRRLPAHKFRRLHLNLPGLPEGSAFQVEPIAAAIERGVALRRPERGVRYVGFVDMSGGSSDDAVLAIAHADAQGRAVLDQVLDQGQRPPFDPRLAVARFALVLDEYGIKKVASDNYGGETFRKDFERFGIAWEAAPKTTSELYEALEPRLNAHEVVLLDVPKVEAQLLGLIWRAGKIGHPNGEHDDWSTAVAGVVDRVLAQPAARRRFRATFGGLYPGDPGVTIGGPRKPDAPTSRVLLRLPSLADPCVSSRWIAKDAISPEYIEKLEELNLLDVGQRETLRRHGFVLRNT